MAAVAAPVSFRLTSSAASFRRASLKTRARLPAVRARGRMVCAAAAKNYNITLLPGDGIGPEIMKVAKEVLEEVGPQYDIEFNFTEALVGGAAIDAHGVPLPPRPSPPARPPMPSSWPRSEVTSGTLSPRSSVLSRASSASAPASASSPTFAPPTSSLSSSTPPPSSARSSRAPTSWSSASSSAVIYFGKPKGFGEDEDGNRTGFNTMVYSVPEIERIARVGFETAKKRNNRLCSVEKSNVLEVSQLWKEVVSRVHEEEYPDVELSHMYVDNAAMQIIRAPTQFDTIVTGNIFGDILSDAASMLTGSIGMLPSAAVGTSGPGLYEPVHGSAPDIAGTDKANPLAQVLSAAMMLRYQFGEEEAAAKIEKAVSDCLDDGYRTGDIMSEGCTQVGCVKMGEILMEKLKA